MNIKTNKIENLDSKSLKSKPKIKANKKTFKYVFPYLLDSRTDTSRPNIVWQMDFTFLDCCLEAAPNSSHYLLIIVDTFNNCIVFSKVFFKKAKRGTITTNKLIKCVEQSIRNYDIKEELILNIDQGPEFISKKYYDLVSGHPFLVGSHSAAANPNHNAVVDRRHRTFKNQTQQHKIPKTVSRTRDLQRFVDRKTNFLNNEFYHQRNKATNSLVT